MRRSARSASSAAASCSCAAIRPSSVSRRRSSRRRGFLQRAAARLEASGPSPKRPCRGPRSPPPAPASSALRSRCGLRRLPHRAGRGRRVPPEAGGGATSPRRRRGFAQAGDLRVERVRARRGRDRAPPVRRRARDARLESRSRVSSAMRDSSVAIVRLASAAAASRAAPTWRSGLLDGVEARAPVSRRPADARRQAWRPRCAAAGDRPSPAADARARLGLHRRGAVDAGELLRGGAASAASPPPGAARRGPRAGRAMRHRASDHGRARGSRDRRARWRASRARGPAPAGRPMGPERREALFLGGVAARASSASTEPASSSDRPRGRRRRPTGPARACACARARLERGDLPLACGAIDLSGPAHFGDLARQRLRSRACRLGAAAERAHTATSVTRTKNQPRYARASRRRRCRPWRSPPSAAADSPGRSRGCEA